MTIEEFIDDYCRLSSMPQEVFREHFVALQCNCGDEACKGFAVVSKNPEAIRNHTELYINRESMDGD